MIEPRSFLAAWTRGALRLIVPIVFAVAAGAPANAADAPQTGNPPQAAPSLSPLEWNRSLIARGRVSEKLGQNEDAMADYTLAIESHALPADEQARALFDRGLLFDGLSRLDEALADYSASLGLSPQFAAALNNRGNVYRRLGRMAEARRDYLAALEAGNPQSQFSYYGLGEVAEAEGGKSEAKEFYAKALAADPKYDLARDRLAALSSGEQMVRLEPPTPNSASDVDIASACFPRGFDNANCAAPPDGKGCQNPCARRTGASTGERSSSQTILGHRTGNRSRAGPAGGLA